MLPMLVGLLCDGSLPDCQQAAAQVVYRLAAAPVAAPERDAAAQQLANAGAWPFWYHPGCTALSLYARLAARRYSALKRRPCDHAS